MPTPIKKRFKVPGNPSLERVLNILAGEVSQCVRVVKGGQTVNVKRTGQSVLLETAALTATPQRLSHPFQISRVSEEVVSIRYGTFFGVVPTIDVVDVGVSPLSTDYSVNMMEVSTLDGNFVFEATIDESSVWEGNVSSVRIIYHEGDAGDMPADVWDTKRHFILGRKQNGIVANAITHSLEGHRCGPPSTYSSATTYEIWGV